MPAPNRRNKGEALAHHISHHASARAQDDRDSLAATRARKDAKWEEAAARLSPATRSDLEQRADQARTDFARASQLNHYSEDVKRGRAKPPIVVLAPEHPPRYFLGLCLRCDREMWVHTAKPRVPICQGCRA